MKFEEMQKSSRKICGLLLCLIGIGITGFAQANQTVGKEVRVRVAFQEKEKDATPEIKPQNVKLFENGKLIQVESFVPVVSQPQLITLLVDSSGSMQYLVNSEQRTAKYLIDSLLGTLSNKIAFIGMNGIPTVEAPFTDDKSTLLKEVGRMMARASIPPTASTPKVNSKVGGTSLFDALWLACLELNKAGVDNEKIILLMSDGFDTTSDRKKKDVLELMLKSKVIVHWIGMGDPASSGTFEGNGVNESLIREITQLSGGSFFMPRKDEMMKPGLDRIIRAMNSYYLISYRSVVGKEVADIKIEFTNSDLKKRNIEISYPRKVYLSR